ncbi:MAG: SH3 domain-containing protein, partial [Desulfobacterales bacterium]|nr:SH3 domain-containing protein [Desulfobacterales bacterium]
QTTVVALETKKGKTKDLAEYREHLKSYRAKKPRRDKYAALERMKKTVPRVVTVRVPVGRVREGPSLNSRIKFTMKKGRTVSIIERKDDWYLIARGTGWAHQSLFFNSY